VEVDRPLLVLEVDRGDPVGLVGDDAGQQQDHREQQREPQVQSAPDRAQSALEAHPEPVASEPDREDGKNPNEILHAMSTLYLLLASVRATQRVTPGMVARLPARILQRILR
jgi:hypothetical protein